MNKSMVLLTKKQHNELHRFKSSKTYKELLQSSILATLTAWKCLYGFDIEPMDSDDVDILATYIKNIIDLQEGNITPYEYNVLNGCMQKDLKRRYR